jgi:preprotein translocase subunit SecG
MKLILNILKWILIILFFPLSLLFVAYFKQRKSAKEYFKDEM